MLHTRRFFKENQANGTATVDNKTATEAAIAVPSPIALNQVQWRCRKNKLPSPYGLNVLKALSIVKHGDNRSKNDCIPVQLAQKSQRFCRVLAL